MRREPPGAIPGSGRRGPATFPSTSTSSIKALNAVVDRSHSNIGRQTMNPVVHFEMPYDNPTRAAKFYESAFGWQMQLLGEEMGNYVLATTTETGQTGPKKPGA